MRAEKIAAAILLTLVAAAARADLTASADIGESLPDSDRAGIGNAIDNGIVYGGALGYRSGSGPGIEIDLQHAGTMKSHTASGIETGKSTETMASVNGYYVFNRSEIFQPFLLVGAGHGRFDQHLASGISGRSESTTGNAGIGAFVTLGPTVAVRGEIREVHSFGSATHDDMLVLLGLQARFGAEKPHVPVAPPSTFVAPPRPLPPPPADDDHDGVPNTIDNCPGTPLGTEVDAHGCPLDDDHDGVPDAIDRCPNTPPGMAVDASGCPLDADHDGVSDAQDKCPDTPAGALVDKDGCPQILTTPIREEVHVLFDKEKSVVAPQFREEVERVAVLARQYPNALVEIQGYTDNKGSAKLNTRLSQARAEAVRNMLVKDFAIEARRISAKGYGPAAPVASNGTEAGRKKNRRVMMVLKAEKKTQVMMTPKQLLNRHTRPAPKP